MGSILHIRNILHILIICNAISSALTEIVTYDGPTYVAEGSEFKITCNVPYSIKPKWSLNGKRLHLNGNEISTVQKNEKGYQFTLRVKNATAAYGGIYKCRSVYEIHHNLVILTGYVTNEPDPGKPYMVDTGKSFELQCNVNTSPTQEKPLQVDWLKDGKPIRNQHQKYQIFDSTNTLQVLNVVEEDCAKYSCRFSEVDKFPAYDITVQCRPPPGKLVNPTSAPQGGSASRQVGVVIANVAGLIAISLIL